MENQFKNKRVIVTGAGKGIGRAICLHFAKLKAYVIAISRTQSDLDSLKKEDSSIEIHRADVADWDVMETLLVDIGPVDCLVNNPAVFSRKPVFGVTKHDLDDLTDINYKAAFHVLQVVSKQMVDHNIKGSIVNVTSEAGLRPGHGISTYCCTKAAVDMMTKCFAIELAPHKIRVNSLNPTLVASGMVRNFDSAEVEVIKRTIPLGNIPGKDDIVHSVMYLLSDYSSMVTGINMPIDGGHLIQPATILDMRLQFKRLFNVENQFKNKRVIVTGAGKGIGRAICVHLAKLKANVIAISRTQSDLDSLKEEDSSIAIYRADIADWDVMETLLVDIGPVDCLVNNAAVFSRNPVFCVTKHDLDDLTDINYKAAFHVLQVVSKQMVDHNIKGSIVNVSSDAGLRPGHGMSTYCCTKAAVDMMTKCFAIELAPHKIRVNSLNPTLVASGMVRNFDSAEVEVIKRTIPLGNIPGEDDIVHSVMYLLSDYSSMVTGINMPIDGGHLIQPATILDM